MRNKLKFALIGCGRIARKHIEVLNKLDRAELVAVADIDKKRAKVYGDEFKIPYYIDYIKMLRSEKIDVVNILTPSGLHARHVIESASYVSNIIVEKPMALTLDDADRMVEVCDKERTRLFVVKQNRYNLPAVKLREAISEGMFGKFVIGTVRVRWTRDQDYYDMDEWRGTWAMDGGVLANQASHHIDMLLWLLGDVESVFAKTATRLVDIEAEDTAVVVLKFTNGALGVIEATTATRPKDIEGSISILGEGGTVEVGGFAMNKIETWSFKAPEIAMNIDDYAQNPPNVYGFGHYEYIDDVIDCILDDKEALVDGLEGRRSLELINAIYESVETGKEVYIRFKPKRCKLGLRNGM